MRDPPRDAAHPAATASRWLRGLGMNALFRPASGGAPKPMVLLLHGLPGSEHNFDLAQAIRRIGRNVLTLHLSRRLGIAGSFSLDHALADTEAAIAFPRLPETAARYRVDPQRLVVPGRSMDGFAAAWQGARDSALLAVKLLDALDIDADAQRLKRRRRRAGRVARRSRPCDRLDHRRKYRRQSAAPGRRMASPGAGPPPSPGDRCSPSRHATAWARPTPPSPIACGWCPARA